MSWLLLLVTSALFITVNCQQGRTQGFDECTGVVSDERLSPSSVCPGRGNLDQESLQQVVTSLSSQQIDIIDSFILDTYTASTWEKCGNLCYKQSLCKFWVWDSTTLSCTVLTERWVCLSYDFFYGDRFCPVEDCDHHHFETWMDVIGPCFRKRVMNEAIYNPSLCSKEPSMSMKKKLTNAVQKLGDTVLGNNALENLAHQTFHNIPKSYKKFCPGHFTEMIHYLNEVVMAPPPFLIHTNDPLGVPITNVILCYMHTEPGRRLLANHKVNEHMRNIVNTYGEFLKDKESLSVFNDLQYGWQSTCAEKVLNITQFELPNPSDTAWGFENFNEFFTRKIKDIKTSRPCNENPKSLTSIGDVDLTTWDQKLHMHDRRYIKNETYSLYQVFNNQEHLALPFVKGVALQVYFSTTKYHRFHAPTNGKIVHAERIPGIIYAIDEISVNSHRNLTGNNTQEKLEQWIKYGGVGVVGTQVYLAHVATRCIFIIDSDDLGGKIALVLVGMTEISSCIIEKGDGATEQSPVAVKKGEELGRFQFGGSSGLILLSQKVMDNSPYNSTTWNIYWNTTLQDAEENNTWPSWKMCQSLIEL